MLQQHTIPERSRKYESYITKYEAENSSSSTHEYPMVIPYFGKDSRRFVDKFSKIIGNQLNVKFIPIYKSFKVKSYFQLKSKTPVALCSNVVYHFTCSCDTNKTYIGMSSRHLSTRVQEHLNFNSNQKSSIKDHIMSCNICSNKKNWLGFIQNNSKMPF